MEVEDKCNGRFKSSSVGTSINQDGGSVMVWGWILALVLEILSKSDDIHQILIHNPILSIKILTFKLLRIVQTVFAFHARFTISLAKCKEKRGDFCTVLYLSNVNIVNTEPVPLSHLSKLLTTNKLVKQLSYNAKQGLIICSVIYTTLSFVFSLQNT